MSDVKARARWALRLLPAIVASAAAVWWVSGASVLAALGAARSGPLAAGIALQVSAAIVLGLRWRAALEGVGARPLPKRRAATVLSLRAQAAAVLAPGEGSRRTCSERSRRATGRPRAGPRAARPSSRARREEGRGRRARGVDHPAGGPCDRSPHGAAGPDQRAGRRALGGRTGRILTTLRKTDERDRCS